MSFYTDQAFGKVYLNLQGATTHNVELGTSASGNLTRIENAINGIPQRLEEVKSQLSNYHSQVQATEEELKKDFPYADELREKSARLAQLNTELTMQEHNQPPVQETGQTESETSEIENKIEPEMPPKIGNPLEVKAAQEVQEAVNFRGVPEQKDKVYFGIPETKSQLTEQTIRDMKLVEAPVIYMNPRTDGQQYKGEILHVDKEQGYCVQLSGKHSLFVHSLEKLERVPEVGENLKLSYPNDEGHKATLTAQETQTRTRCRK